MMHDAVPQSVPFLHAPPAPPPDRRPGHTAHEAAGTGGPEGPACICNFIRRKNNP